MLTLIKAWSSVLRGAIMRILFLPGYQRMIDRAWRHAFLESIELRPGERILEVSPGWFSTCAELARANPAVRLAAARPNAEGKAVVSDIEDIPCCGGRLSCKGASFDKVICTLALHRLPLDQKLTLLKEMRRVLRRGGTLFLAEFDKPLSKGEGAALQFIAYFLGPAAAQAHFDGTWFTMIARAGFSSVRRLNSYSETIAQVAIVEARRK